MTKFEYYYSDENRYRQGPFTLEEFFELAEGGRIKDDFKVTHTGMTDWVPYRAVADAVESEFRAMREDALKQAKEEEENERLIKQGLKTCAFCAELIQLKATKCKHCGEWLEERQGGTTDLPSDLSPPSVSLVKDRYGSLQSATRWTIRIVASVFVLIVYVLSKEVFPSSFFFPPTSESGAYAQGFLVGGIRGALLLVSVWFVWKVTK